MAKKSMKRLFAVSLSTILLVLAMTLPESSHPAFAEDLSQSIKDTGHKVVESVKQGLQKTSDYLQSKQFHQDVSRFAQDTGKAIKNGGNWIGKQLDNAKK